MSIIGWVIESEELEEKFSSEIPEEFEMKVRFDPDTGKKLPKKQKVITKHSSICYKFGEEEYQEIGHFIDEMSIKFDFDYLHQDVYGNDSLVFGLEFEDGATHDSIVKMKPKLKAIKKKLLKLGIPFDSKKQPTYFCYDHS